MNKEQHFVYHSGGCDGTGKSTIVEELSKQTGIQTKHFGVPKDYYDAKKQYFDFINELDSSIICDRFHDGEWIFAPLYRGYTGDYMRSLESKIVENSNYMFIYVKTDLDTIIQRTRIRGEDFVKEEHFQIVLNKYEKYLEYQSMPFIIIDTTNSKTKNDVDRILKHSDNVNTIWNAIRGLLVNFTDSNVILPWGNVEPTNMVVFDSPFGNNQQNYSTLHSFDNNVCDIFTREDLIYKSWFTSLIPYQVKGDYNDIQAEASQHLIKLQYKRLKPEKVHALNERTALILEKFLNVKVSIL